jgi:hypothetical protein
VLGKRSPRNTVKVLASTSKYSPIPSKYYLARSLHLYLLKFIITMLHKLMMNLFLVKWCLQQESGNNLCGYYVCELLMEYSRRTPKEILEVRKKYTQFICCHYIYTHTIIHPKCRILFYTELLY